MLRLAVAVAVFALAPARADACSCLRHESFAEYIKHSDAMFRATITRIAEKDKRLVYTMKVTRVWKGPLKVGQKLTVYDQERGGCPARLEKGDFVLGPYRNPEDGKYYLSLCSYLSDYPPSDVSGW